MVTARAAEQREAPDSFIDAATIEKPCELACREPRRHEPVEPLILILIVLVLVLVLVLPIPKGPAARALDVPLGAKVVPTPTS